jgi:hypothetical protein
MQVVVGRNIVVAKGNRNLPTVAVGDFQLRSGWLQ